MSAVAASRGAAGSSASAGRVALAADVGGTTTRVGVVDADGHISSVRRTPTPQGADAVIDHLASQLESLLAECSGSPAGAVTVGVRHPARRAGSDVAGIAVAIPGRLDDDGDAWSMALNLGVSGPVALRSSLEARLPGPIRIGNDVRLAALGAAHHHPDAARLAYVSAGTGVAGCLVDRSRGLDHRIDLPGEVGHLPMPGLAGACVCGQVGCAETAAGGRSMIEQWQLRGGDATLDVTGIWACADAGDPAAIAVRDDCVSALASIAQLYGVAVGADAVVVGGGISSLGNALLSPVRAELTRRADASDFVAGYALADRVRLTAPDSEYGLVGAGLTALTATSST